jgi:hypothetical protein
MKVFFPVLLLLLFAFSAHPGSSLRATRPALALLVIQDSNASPGKPKVVYVNDFDLEVARRGAEKNSPPGIASDAVSGEPSGAPSARAPSSATPTASSSKPPRSPASVRPAEAQVDRSPTDRANTLVNVMSENLVRALEKSGYTVRRLRAGETQPQAGLRIRGVFAEPDEENRIRRLLIGGDSATPKMLLYVGVDNLARPEQPLYELAKPASNDGRHGPVISVTSYSPVARFEMDKNPADDDIKKITADIVADLNALLKANPAGDSQ